MLILTVVYNNTKMSFNFLSIFKQYAWGDIISKVESITTREVEMALSKEKRDVEDFLCLISKAAIPYLNEMAEMSQNITLKRFGKVMQLYVPMYLSNECSNICTYCGFSVDNHIPRVTLTIEQIQREIKELKKNGFDHVLLLTGESPRQVNVSYFKEVLAVVREYFSHVSLEVQPLETEEYKELIKVDLDGVVVYQETYRKETYRDYHPRGRKSDFEYRLNTPDRVGLAGMQKIGLGVLLGLEDWRADAFFTALHFSYLKKYYWRSKYSVSFPRLRPAKGVAPTKNSISDKELVQLIVAWRLLDEDIELHLSTRESGFFRDNVFQLGITSMSAGSKTSPGGYSCFSKKPELEQFEISDERNLIEVASMLKDRGYDPITKDWDKVFS